MTHRARRLVPAIAIAIVASCAGSAGAAETVVPFAYTGAPQTFVVPGDVDLIHVVATGGHGGRGHHMSFGGAFISTGGAGARVEAAVPVTPGETLAVVVGGNGPENYFGPQAGVFGGGGAPGIYGSRAAGGGGGASDLRACGAAPCVLTGASATDPRLLVAGGGGGGGAADGSITGGAGGAAGAVATAGGTGQDDATAGGGHGGGAGTDAAGGAAGVGGAGFQSADGEPGTAGGGGAATVPVYSTNVGGSGGGGWFGGGSGGNGAWDAGSVAGSGGGGAGSSHVAATARDAQIATDASGVPSVTLSYTPDPRLVVVPPVTTPPAPVLAPPAAPAPAVVPPAPVAPTRCTARRAFTITLQTKTTIKSASVTVDGRKVKLKTTKKGRSARVDLTGRTKATVKVVIRVVTKGGKVRTATRTYHTCVGKKDPSTTVRL
jgi:hypothetical protein